MTPKLVALITFTLLSYTTIAQKATIKNNNNSKLTQTGINTASAGGGLFIIGSILYIKSISQKEPNTNTLTVRGAANRLLGYVGMGAGITTAAIGGIMYSIGKSHDAIKQRQRKVSLYLTPVNVGVVVKL